MPTWLRTAVVSDEGRYRYRLGREREGGTGTVAFIMLNPSTADGTKDDPTIRRCMGFAASWGHRRLDVVNLFAFRSTDPTVLKHETHFIGPANTEHIQSVLSAAEVRVAAWGAQPVAEEAARTILGSRTDLTCLGTTKSGAPRHPLYVERSAVLKPWRMASA